MRTKLLCLLLVLPLIGCLEDDTADPTEYLIINTLDATPSVIMPGATSTLTVEYTADTESTVTMAWQAEDGEIAGADNTAEWTAPDDPGFYTVTVTITAGNLSAMGHHTLQVIEDPAAAPLLEITALDAEGDPVVGMDVKLQLQIDGVQVDPAKALTHIEFSLTQPCEVEIDVYDLSGRHIRNLVDEAMEAGIHLTDFDGRIEDDIALKGTQILIYEMVATDNGLELFRDRKYMALHDFDPENCPLLGTTDANGRIVVDDIHLFPFLFALPPMEGRDELMTYRGVFTVSPEVLLLAYVGESDFLIQRHIMHDGPNRVTLRMGPMDKTFTSTLEPEAPVLFSDPIEVVPIPTEFYLGQNYPNPFN